MNKVRERKGKAVGLVVGIGYMEGCRQWSVYFSFCPYALANFLTRLYTAMPSPFSSHSAARHYYLPSHPPTHPGTNLIHKACYAGHISAVKLLVSKASGGSLGVSLQVSAGRIARYRYQLDHPDQVGLLEVASFCDTYTRILDHYPGLLMSFESSKYWIVCPSFLWCSLESQLVLFWHFAGCKSLSVLLGGWLQMSTG
jgi:hypothetical protein